MLEMQAFYSQVMERPAPGIDRYQAALQAIAQMTVDAIRRFEMTTPWAVWGEPVK